MNGETKYPEVRIMSTKAFGKYRVASGVFMIFISSEDGLETKVKKVMIVR